MVVPVVDPLVEVVAVVVTRVVLDVEVVLVVLTAAVAGIHWA